jgi:hypothetical protein
VFSGAPADTIGVEYTPTPAGSRGNMFYLVQGPSGPERGAGFEYQLTYDVSTSGGSAYQLNMHPAPNSGFASSPRFSLCPSEILLPGYLGGSALLVPFP